MTAEELGTFGAAKKHAQAARREAHAMLDSLMPPAFWEHARASKKETKAACHALRHAVRNQLRRPQHKRAFGRRRIEIT